MLDGSINYESLMKKASTYLDEMQAIIRPAAVRPLLWILSKIWTRIYDQIIVNENGLNTVRELLARGEDNVILVPTHKSYIDFLLIAYIHYQYKIELPFTCGEEQLLNIALLRFLLKSGGGFFLNSKLSKDKLF